MARPVRVRERYTADRGRLTRLEEAVEKDLRITSDEKVKIRELLHELVSLFVSIDDRLHDLLKRETQRQARVKMARRRAA